MIVRPFETAVEELTLRGTCYLPDTRTRAGAPAAALMHGFGGNRIEGARLFVSLARVLTAQGIAVLAWDRAGHGESDGSFFDTTVSRDVRHTHLVLDAFAGLPDIDADDLHLLGLSLGAVEAVAVAASSPRPIRSVTMLSTAAVFVDEIASGFIQGRPLDTVESLGYFDFLGQRMGPAMIADAHTFDPYAAAAGYAGPTLLLHGTEDFVPLRYAERYVEVLDRAELEVIPGADHGWMTVPHRDLVERRTLEHIQAHARHGSEDHA